VALKGLVGSGVGEWGKQFGATVFLWSLCVFGCISVVTQGACVRHFRALVLCWSVGDECVGGSGSLVAGWGRIAGEDEAWGREWVRRGRTSCWEGEKWILAQVKKGE
jgi:hypothetical protein